MLSLAALVLLQPQANVLATPEPGFRRPPQTVPGDKAVKILFLRTRYADDPPTLVSYQPDLLDRVAKRIDEYFRRESYGLFTVGSYEISSLFRVAAKKDYIQIHEEAGGPPIDKHKPLERDAIDGLNQATNRHVGQIFDFICIEAKNPGQRNFAFAASKLSFYPSAPNEYAYFHELGHCMGFGHSNALISEVPGETLPPRDSRYIAEYGDHASAMGAVDIWAYSLLERYTMGWIGDSDKYPRYIKKFDWGENSFVSHDQVSPKGCVGGYVEGRFGIEAAEYRRDKTKRIPVPGADEVPQRLWFSLLTTGGIGRNYADLPRPFLLAHITGAAFNGNKGLLQQDNRTTVLLDLSPSDNPQDLRPISKGLFEGQSATIRQTDGSAITVKFLRYDKTDRRAVIDLRLEPK